MPREPRVVAAPPGLLVGLEFRPGWVAVGYYLARGGAMRLSSLSIAPGPMPEDTTESTRGPETKATADRNARTRPTSPSQAVWLAEALYLRTDGNQTLRAELLREVPLAAMQAAVDAQAVELVQWAADLRSYGIPEHATEFADALDLADRELTEAKLDYLEAAWHFSQSKTFLNKEISAAMRISSDQLRDRLGSARKAGYLTSPGRGRKGGDLTPLGRELAKRHLPRKTK